MIVRVRLNVKMSHKTKLSCDPKGKQVSWNEMY